MKIKLYRISDDATNVIPIKKIIVYETSAQEVEKDRSGCHLMLITLCP